MEIVSGDCTVQLDNSEANVGFTTGTFFDVPAKSGFSIAVEGGICEYICSFID